jgi:signal transduction histidine kinase
MLVRLAPVSTSEVEARRRLELDLHERAQERLVVVALTLRRAAAQVRGTAAEPLVTEAVDQLHQGLAELRDVARGIHPYVLGAYGLRPALEGLAARVPQRVDLRVDCDRFDTSAEAALYFAVEEALAGASADARATVTVERIADAVVTEVAIDDGPFTGSAGLARAAERIEALGGRLDVESARVRAVVLV